MEKLLKCKKQHLYMRFERNKMKYGKIMKINNFLIQSLTEHTGGEMSNKEKSFPACKRSIW